MKKLKNILFLLGLAGPAVANLSCSSVFLGEFRDAAITGTASFIEQATFDLLTQLAGSDLLQPAGSNTAAP